jgi:hypothetical protein
MTPQLPTQPLTLHCPLFRRASIRVWRRGWRVVYLVVVAALVSIPVVLRDRRAERSSARGVCSLDWGRGLVWCHGVRAG